MGKWREDRERRVKWRHDYYHRVYKHNETKKTWDREYAKVYWLNLKNDPIRYKKNKEKQREYKLHYQEKNKERSKAYDITNEALRKGMLKKEPCIICNDTKVNAHHDTYDKPLEVIWLCNKHHQDLHIKRRKTNNG